MRVRSLVIVSGIRSLPKKRSRLSSTAPLAQPWPDGWSGKAGVPSGGPNCGVDGSKSGSQPGSPAVAGLPSFDASRIAVTGRQEFHRYLLCQQPITASAAARFTTANSRALAATSNR